MTKPKPIKNWLAWQYRERRLARPARSGASTGTEPIIVAGLFSTANGIGKAARGTYMALRSLGIKCQALDLSDYFQLRDLAFLHPTIETLPSSPGGR